MRLSRRRLLALLNSQMEVLKEQKSKIETTMDKLSFKISC